MEHADSGPHRDEQHEGHTDQRSNLAERLTGVHDPRDPDGLLTVEQDADHPDPPAFGHPETDTLEREQERFAKIRAGGDDDRELPVPPRHDGLTGLDTTS
jgi:hypothetical protein